MNFGISGILYGTKRSYDSLYDGKGSKQPSTYHKETCGFKAVHDQPLATQRSNGFAVGGAKLGSGILCNGVDFHRFMDGYIATNASKEDQINLQPHGDGNWEVSYWQGIKQHGVQAICSLEEGVRLGASMLSK